MARQARPLTWQAPVNRGACCTTRAGAGIHLGGYALRPARERFKLADCLGGVAEADGVHADVSGAVDVLLQVIEKDGRFGSGVEPLADDAEI